MWDPGDVIVWRGILNNRVWHAQPTVVVKNSVEELVLTLLPGTECVAEETYPSGKKAARRWWDFKDADWKLAKYIWHTNRLLLILEPQKYYSTILFWDHESDEFICFYINFQVPFKRSHCGIDTLDLDLDIIINPDLSFEWKDMDDYNKAIEHELITTEWEQGIDDMKPEIFDKLENRQYQFDGSWLAWKPDPSWKPPSLPENWDKI